MYTASNPDKAADKPVNPLLGGAAEKGTGRKTYPMWETIKKILSKEGGKCIIVEEGKPSYLVMKLEEYEKKQREVSGKEMDIEKVNRDIAEWKANEGKGAEPENQEENEEVKVEDLPF